MPGAPAFSGISHTLPHRYSCLIREYGKNRRFGTFTAFQSREGADNINLMSVSIVHGETVRAQAQYIIRTAVQAVLHAVQGPVRPVRNY
jgi:hypothetical protein